MYLFLTPAIKINIGKMGNKNLGTDEREGVKRGSNTETDAKIPNAMGRKRKERRTIPRPKMANKRSKNALKFSVINPGVARVLRVCQKLTAGEVKVLCQ